MWSSKRLDRYLVELELFILETDHKPMVPLINQKDLPETPLCCQRMLMRLTRFKAQARYTWGKNLHVADTLSRSPLSEGQPGQLHEDVVAHVNAVTSSWPVSDTFLDRIRAETMKNVKLSTAVQYTVSVWPTFKEDVQLAARDLFAVRGELSVVNGILAKGSRIIFPFSMRREI